MPFQAHVEKPYSLMYSSWNSGGSDEASTILIGQLSSFDTSSKEEVEEILFILQIQDVLW